MTKLIHLALFLTIAALGVGLTLGADEHCDCHIVPFEPDPPCFDRCVAKHLAIASADDLQNIFGLPKDVATAINFIPPDQRPQSLEDYRRIVPSPAYEALQKRAHTLTADSFAQVRRDAMVAGRLLH